MLRGPIRFTNALGGTVDFIYPGPAIDMQSPTSAGAVNAATYVYYAQSFDMVQWEIGSGVYTSASGTFARTTVISNSNGDTAKINFSTAPQIMVFDTAAAFGLASDVAANAAAIAALQAATTTWTPYTPTVVSTSGTLTTVVINSASTLTLGKVMYVQFDFTITAVGTGAGFLDISVPTYNSIVIGTAIELNNGAGLGGCTTSSSTSIRLRLYNNGNTVAANARWQGGAVLRLP